MVSRKDIKSYDFDTIEEYFDYIVGSKVNGNFSQVKELISELSKNQKKQFLSYLAGWSDNDDTWYVKNETMKQL